jgi:hypothetical protein
VAAWLTAAACANESVVVPPPGTAAALRSHCGDCHCDGAAEGGVNLDALLGPDGGVAAWPLSPAHPDRSRWLDVWRNLRAGTMPPPDAPRPSGEERSRLVTGIEEDVFGVAADRPDPGRVVLRRLNRFEYANTVRDLTGLDLDVADDLPADDTGYGFDTIAEVLTVSPLLLEKYLAVAAEVGARIAVIRPGPTAAGQAYPEPQRRVFPFGPPPDGAAEAAAHRRRTLERLAARGFRRPPDGVTVDRLVAVAEAAEARGDGFEGGVAAALTAVLSSPRFLFRIEGDAAGQEGDAVLIDEHALASRLSYFLWSTMPDDELFTLAVEGGLRARLTDVVDRMIHDPRSDALVAHFVGQWLRSRDVEALPFSLKRIVKVADEKDEARVQRQFDEKLRPAMRAESELLFAHVLRTGLPATELLVGRSTFLNADLAAHYGIPGVAGAEMRLVELPDGRRGGILAHGGVLAVTSTPSRTSPVKRGLFVLESLLGVPAPPVPPDIPSLEVAAAKAGKGASIRELMELHRADAACASCHARMDPIGLALEEYDAIGRWRGAGTATPGRLVTGERFTDTAELARRIAVDRRADFHRCLVEKLLTYAIGRGLEVHDAPAVRGIVAGLEAGGGLDAAVRDVVASVPFQMRRRDALVVTASSAPLPSPTTQAPR